MSTSYDLVRLIREIAESADRQLEQAHADGVVVTREGSYASVRLGANEAPTPGFYVGPGIDAQAGDHVLVFRPKGYALVLAVLNRNAVVPTLLTHPHAQMQVIRSAFTGPMPASTTWVETLSWPVAFADTQYVPQITVVQGKSYTSGLVTAAVVDWTATDVTVRLHNADSVDAEPGLLIVGVAI